MKTILQEAQLYPGDSGLQVPKKCFSIFWITKSKNVIIDSEFLEDLTFDSDLLKDPDFMPALQL
jgi:hypothetical protein